MKRAVQPTPARPSRLTWRVRVMIYGLVIAAAVLLRFWLLGPTIPLPDLANADPALVEAVETAAAFVRQSPRSPQAWGELGLLLMAHRYSAEAEECFQRAAELDDSSWQWLYFKAVSQQRDRPQQAAATLGDAIVRDHSAELPKLLRGEILLGLGRPDDAQQQFRSVLRSSPENARAHLGLARVLYANDDLAAALESLEHAATHLSTRKAALELKAQIFQRQQNQTAAEEALARARELPPDAPWPDDPLAGRLDAARVGKASYLKRVTALRAAGRIAEANAVSQEAERKHPELYLIVEGSMRLERRDAAGAEEVLRQALQLDPSSVEARFALGQSLARQDKHVEAEKIFRELLEREPSYGPAWLELGRCLARQHSADALAAFRSAVQYMPLAPEAHEALADALSVAGEPAEARQHAEYARKLRENDRAAP